LRCNAFDTRGRGTAAHGAGNGRSRGAGEASAGARGGAGAAGAPFVRHRDDTLSPIGGGGSAFPARRERRSFYFVSSAFGFSLKRGLHHGLVARVNVADVLQELGPGELVDLVGQTLVVNALMAKNAQP
jgi:hypothetical protein